MFIQTEDTPNPAVMKFMPGCEVLPDGYEGDPTIESREAAQVSPLAEVLFAIEGVQSLFLGDDFIAVARSDSKDWDVLRPQVLAAIMEHFVSGAPVIHAENAQDEREDEDQSDTARAVRKILEEKVRPMVARDGGDIVFHHFDDGVVYVSMRGACSGCPSATITLKAGVERILKELVPEVREVRQYR